MRSIKMRRTAFYLLFLISTASAISLPDKYDHSVRPNNGGVADVANVSMQILAIRNVDEDEQTVSVDFLLRVFWVDSRLANLVERETVFVKQIPEVWVPHIFIANAADSKDAQKSDRSLKLKPDGTLDFSERVAVKLNCPMYFWKYPFGQQTCKIQFNSNGYTTIHLVLIWNGIISLDIPFYDPEYTLKSIEQTSERKKTPTGEYSYAYVDITMSRCSSRILIRVLLPGLILTILSYFLTFYMLGDKKTSCESKTGGGDIEDEDVTKNLPLRSKLAFHVLRVAVNALYLLLIVIIKQTNFVTTPKFGTVTGLDISTGFMGLVVLIHFVLSLQMCFLEWTRITGKLIEKKQKFAEKVFVILRLSIPIVSILFFIAYIGISLS